MAQGVRRFNDVLQFFSTKTNYLPIPPYIDSHEGMELRRRYQAMSENPDVEEQIEWERHTTSETNLLDTSGPVTNNVASNVLNILPSELLHAKASELAIGGGLTGVTTALGVGAVAVGVEQLRQHGAVVPGYKYLGPGNDLDRGEPVDETDAIARDHDIAYQKVLDGQSDKSVLEIDKEYIEKFRQHYKETGNLGSKAGEVGLSVKNTVEQQVGVIYPQMPSTHKRPGSALEATADDSAATEKKAKSGTNDGASTSASAGGQAEVEPVEHVFKPFASKTSDVFVFNKVHRFLSYGIAYQRLVKQFKFPPLTAGTEFKQGYEFVTTPFMSIPWERPYMYMTPYEFNSLPEGSTCTDILLEVHQRNVRVAFPTNSSSSDLATLNQNKNAVYSVGLLDKIDGMNVKYSAYTTEQPMKPTDLVLHSKSDHDCMANCLYGMTDNDSNMQYPPANQFGLPLANNCYFACTKPIGNVHDGWKGGWANLSNHVTEVNATDSAGRDMFTLTYKPSKGLLKIPRKTFTHALRGYNATYLSTKFNDIITKKSVAYNNNRVESTVTCTDPSKEKIELLNGNNAWFKDKFGYTSPIEKSQWIQNVDASSTLKQQPSVHVGVQPVPALTTSSYTNYPINFTDTQAYWEVRCTMSVRVPFGSKLPLGVSAFEKEDSNQLCYSSPDLWNNHYEMSRTFNRNVIHDGVMLQ